MRASVINATNCHSTIIAATTTTARIMTVRVFIKRAKWPNEKREPREAAASDSGTQSQRNGCLPLAPRSGWAARSSWPKTFSHAQNFIRATSDCDSDETGMPADASAGRNHYLDTREIRLIPNPIVGTALVELNWLGAHSLHFASLPHDRR